MPEPKDQISDLVRTAAWLVDDPSLAPSLLFAPVDAASEALGVATEFALRASEACEKPGWLVDLDFQNNPAFYAFESGQHVGTGQPGRAYDASLGQAPTYRLVPQAKTNAANKLLTVNQIDQANLMVTRFRTERLDPAQSVLARPTRQWWQTLRTISDMITVLAPPLDRSPAGALAAPDMDGVILVVAADQSHPAAIASARAKILQSGGHLLGVVMTGLRKDARFFHRIAA